MVGELLNYAGDPLQANDPELFAFEPATGSAIVGANDVAFSGSARVILLPNIPHTTPAFTMEATVSVSPSYDFMVGLAGSQVLNNRDSFFRVTREGSSTRLTFVQIVVGLEVVRKTRVVPFLLSGSVGVKVTYFERLWNFSVSSNGSVFTLSYRYVRSLSQGSVTSRFSVANISGSLSLTSLRISMPIATGGRIYGGDSITNGNALPYPGLSYAEIIRNSGPASQFGKYVIAAAGSASSADLVAQLNFFLLIQPSEVRILIGDNDDYSSPLTFSDNIQEIMTTLLDAGIDVKIMNLTPEKFDAGYLEFCNRISARYPTRVLSSWTLLARNDNPSLANPAFVTDHVHPNQAGHRRLAGLENPIFS